MIRAGFIIVAVLFLAFLYEVGRDYSPHVAFLIFVGAVFGSVLTGIAACQVTQLPPPAVSAHNPPSE